MHDLQCMISGRKFTTSRLSVRRAALGCLRQVTSTQQPEQGAPVLVVQDRSQSRSQTEEALRLAQTFSGEMLQYCRQALMQLADV